MGVSFDVCVANVADDVVGRGGREVDCEKGRKGGEEDEEEWKNRPFGCRRMSKSDSLAHFKFLRMTRSFRSLEKWKSGNAKVPGRRGGDSDPPRCLLCGENRPPDSPRCPPEPHLFSCVREA